MDKHSPNVMSSQTFERAKTQENLNEYTIFHDQTFFGISKTNEILVFLWIIATRKFRLFSSRKGVLLERTKQGESSYHRILMARNIGGPKIS